MKYTVWVDDEYHFATDSDHQNRGEFETRDDAVAAAKEIVDSWLRSRHVPGMTADELFEGYKQYGQDPVVRGPTDETQADFSAWEYAQERCEELCDETLQPQG